MSRTRTRIENHVRAHPGVHVNRLVRGLDLAHGQVQYHLRRLAARDAVVAEPLYGRTHYYPPGFEEWEREAIALLRRETPREIVGVLLRVGPARPAAVAERAGIARSTLAWQVDRLIGAGLVTKRTIDDGVMLGVVRPEDAIRLLGELEPSLPARLVDRYIRLVDHLLTEGENYL